MRKASYYNKALKLLQELHTDYPNHGLGQHLSTALSDYGDFWGITDKELCFAIEKYMSELALDLNNVAPDDYVEKIVKDAQNLFKVEDEEEEF